MKRILEQSPVTGYQLFRYAKRRADGSTAVLATYYIRHAGKDTCTGTDRLKDAKAAVKKQAGEDAQARRRHTAGPDEATVGTILDLVIEDYAANGQKTLKHAKGQIERGLRPYFGEMLASNVDSDQIERWIALRRSRRMRKAVRRGNEKLEPASINRKPTSS